MAIKVKKEVSMEKVTSSHIEKMAGYSEALCSEKKIVRKFKELLKVESGWKLRKEDDGKGEGSKKEEIELTREGMSKKKVGLNLIDRVKEVKMKVL